jgi:hypothetical protein
MALISVEMPYGPNARVATPLGVSTLGVSAAAPLGLRG